MDKTPTIGVCMIVKNEEKLLEKCLKSVSRFVQQIVVVDTGSTDNTIDIAKNFSADIYYYPWDNSFSNARNFSISKSACDWILLLDADESIVQQDIDTLIDFIKTTELDGAHFKVYNYVGQGTNTNYTLHNALRLLRNNGEYEFKGDIHEQIVRLDGKDAKDRFKVLNVRLNHYGYLDEIVKEKHKRQRNIPILMKQLAEDPSNAFTLFNLGNEYAAQSDYTKALQTYKKAIETMDVTQAYAPHLIYRSAMCLYNLKNYDEAISFLNDGLKIYPSCTDMEYLKGLIYTDYKRYTLAIDSFNKALNMGDPPDSLRFSDFCGSTKPLLALGRLYLDLGDYVRALECLNRVIETDNKMYFVLYYIAKALNKLFDDKQIVEQRLSVYFSSLDHLPNLLILTDVFIEQQLYKSAGKYIEIMSKLEGYETEKKLLSAKLNFYTGNYELASDLFYELATTEKLFSLILPDILRCSTIYLFASLLLTNPDKTEKALELISKNCGDVPGKVYTQAYNVVFNIDENAFEDDENIEDVLAVFTELLNIIIKTKEFDIFEKLLYVYNYIGSDSVLLSLAQIYYDNGYYQLAKSTVVNSITKYKNINEKDVEILYNSFFKC